MERMITSAAWSSQRIKSGRAEVSSRRRAGRLAASSTCPDSSGNVMGARCTHWAMAPGSAGVGLSSVMLLRPRPCSACISNPSLILPHVKDVGLPCNSLNQGKLNLYSPVCVCVQSDSFSLCLLYILKPFATKIYILVQYRLDFQLSGENAKQF